MLLKILAYFFNWELVWLIDFQGKTYLTKVNYDGFGKWAHVYWDTKVGHVRLLDNNICRGESFYVVMWKKYK